MFLLLIILKNCSHTHNSNPTKKMAAHFYNLKVTSLKHSTVKARNKYTPLIVYLPIRHYNERELLWMSHESLNRGKEYKRVLCR